MCGIAGLVNIDARHEPPSMSLMRSMASSIRHRGPDEFGVYRDAFAGLVSARLAIIDLTTGQQPIGNEDEGLWIVFNGEIYNFVELREELLAHGHRFRTHSDTEVIVHAFEQWGEECFPRFNGQWAIALWDSRSRKLVLSRDPIGICPLYVRERNGRVWFGSEVKAIFCDPSVDRRIDPRGLDQTFTYWSSIAPVNIFEGIEELPPGSVTVYEKEGRGHQKIFWRPEYPIAGEGGRNGSARTTLAEATEILRDKLMRATRLRMLRADVPVGSYLSGGLDSSLIAWMGRQVKEGTFRTFSIRFEDAEFDETKHQRLMASTLDSSHAEIMVRRSDIARIFPDVVLHAERPVLRTGPAPLYMLSELVHGAGFKCVLTGEGADEMLAGYDIFREAKIRHFWSKFPESTVRPRLFERLYPYLARSPQQTKGMALQFWRRGLDHPEDKGFSHDPRWRTTSSLKRFFSDEVAGRIAASRIPDPLASLPPAFDRWDPLGRAQYLEIVTLLSTYIISSQGDRMLMANSVEGRFPVLDPDVMDFCNQLPPEYKLLGLDEKHILKRIAKGIIPEEIIRRPKQPYRAPDAVSFVSPGAPEYVEEMLSDAMIAEAGVFNAGTVRGLVQKCIAVGRGSSGSAVMSNSDNMAFVGILSTQLLHAQFIRRNAGAAGEEIAFTAAIDRVAVPSHHPED